MTMKQNIELTVSSSLSQEKQLATRADLRAVAAYLQAMSEDPITGTVTIGRLVIEIHVGRCLRCFGSGRAGTYSTESCPVCRGSGTDEPAPEIETR